MQMTGASNALIRVVEVKLLEVERERERDWLALCAAVEQL